MFARSIAVVGAASVFAAMAGTDADASGRHRGSSCSTCYQKVMTPPVYRTVVEKVLVQAAHCTTVQTPPVYGTQPRHVVLEPTRQVSRYQPAVYGRVRVQHLVSPAHTKWVYKRGRHGAQYRCAVDVPAKYRSSRQKVQVRPAAQWIETRPAVTGVVQQRVMISPGTSRQVCQPAIYKTVSRQVMVSPGTEQWVPAARRARRHW